MLYYYGYCWVVISVNTFSPSLFLCGQSYILHKENGVMMTDLLLAADKNNNVDDFKDIFFFQWWCHEIMCLDNKS